MPITILPVTSALMRIEPGDFYRQLALRLRVGEEVPLDEVVAHLESIGYGRREPVEMVGEYSVRAGFWMFFRRSPRNRSGSTFSATRWNRSGGSTWNRSGRC